MNIGGFLKFSLLDYPGRISCVIFCQGCNLRCSYCHNPDLQEIKNGKISCDSVIEFLKNRKGKLEGVVFSGGEPLIQPDLRNVIKMVKDMGFLVGMHTSGSIPEKLEEVLDLLNWIGLDAKGLPESYKYITAVDAGENFLKSLRLVKNSGTPFEIRTTYDNSKLSELELVKMAEMLALFDVKDWVIQQCVIRKEEGDVTMHLPSENTIKEIENFVKLTIRRS